MHAAWSHTIEFTITYWLFVIRISSNVLGSWHAQRKNAHSSSLRSCQTAGQSEARHRMRTKWLNSATKLLEYVSLGTWPCQWQPKTSQIDALSSKTVAQWLPFPLVLRPQNLPKLHCDLLRNPRGVKIDVEEQFCLQKRHILGAKILPYNMQQTSWNQILKTHS